MDAKNSNSRYTKNALTNNPNSTSTVPSFTAAVVFVHYLRVSSIATTTHRVGEVGYVR